MFRCVRSLIVVGLLSGPVLAAEPVAVSVEGLVLDANGLARPVMTESAPPIPEPASMALYAAGAVGLLLRRNRRLPKAQ